MKTPVDEHSDLNIDTLWHPQPVYKRRYILTQRDRKRGRGSGEGRRGRKEG